MLRARALTRVAMALAAVIAGSRLAVRAEPPALQTTTTTDPRTVLDRYCIACHNSRTRVAQLVLEKDAVDTMNVGAAAAAWEKVARKMRARQMPPVGARRPTIQEYEGVTRWIEDALDKASALHPNPGRPSVHRLNRAEYANAVRDLLGVEIDSRAFLPPDDSGYGFDNVADVLSTSPGLLERYLLAAGKIASLALGDPHVKPSISTYRVPPLYAQDDRMSEDLPFGSRGGLAVRHQFPVDGEYVIKVRLQRSYYELIRGLSEPHTLELRLDRGLVRSFPVGAPVGAAPAQIQEQLRDGDANLEVRLPVKAGLAVVGAAFVKEPKLAEGVYLPRPPLASFEYSGKIDTEPAVDSLQVMGPYHGQRSGRSPSDRILICAAATPEGASSFDRACARRIISGLARRAYRRPVTEGDIRALLAVYDKGRVQGGFEGGIRWAVERILVAPDFLFRIEHDPAGVTPGVPYALSDLELASRLSFFLWSSLPDDALLENAVANRLHEPGVLQRQLRRMLVDERASALVTNFAGQWLYLRNVRGHAPDPNLFPDFDDNLRDAFGRETELFLESQLREDRSVVDLLRADYTFVNERLARHYGIPGVYGSHFRRVTLAGTQRAGLLGQGSILTVTSYAHRTSPVVRGKWLLENLLGAPPPPPPPNVPSLRENGEGRTPASVRERLEAHRKNPVCAACHARMDPLGFALENFDAIGRWRDTDESGKSVDASGTLPDGTSFTGPAEFRNALVARQGEFVSTVIEKLLTYALGRGLEPYDMPAVRAIGRAAAPDYKWSAIIAGIVESVPFRMRVLPVDRTPPPSTQRARSAQP